MIKKKHISRRRFLGQASCAALGSSTLLSSLISLKAINAGAITNSEVGQADDYKALVCILLEGGNDSFNMVVPTENDEYNSYAATRSNQALAKDDLLPLNIDIQGRTFGIHPAMTQIQALFNQNQLSFINNIGTLIHPTNKQQVFDASVKLPLGLFSHADQVQQWQTGLPHQRSAIGWGGKIADLIRDMNATQDISMNVSLSGTNVFQKGNQVIEYVIDPYNGSVGIDGYAPDNMYDMFNIQKTAAIDSLLSHEYQNIFQKTYADVIRRSRDAHLQFDTALEHVPDLTTTFSDNYVSESLQMVARTIAAREALGMKRQIFFVNFGGWDHHDELLNNQFGMFTVLSTAMHEFSEALKELQIFDSVTTFTISEFARTLTSNGNGTDHAWGGNVMAMGGKVQGGQFFGTFPSLVLDNPGEIGDGVLIPTTSTDEYFAELALWFGISPTDLGILFPNLHQFYDPQSSQLPIGFLTI